MQFLSPETYLIGLIGLLFLIAVLVGRQVLRVRSDEINLLKLEKNSEQSKNNASELYELASVQLKKRLYPQAVSNLKKALKKLDQEPDEAKALIENALGFALAAQDDFEAAISHYKTALKAKADYPVAINNLAFANQRLLRYEEAKKLYEKVLDMDPKNKTAKKQIQKIENRINNRSPDTNDTRGF